MACWPQGATACWPRAGDGRRGSGWADRDAVQTLRTMNRRPSLFGLGRRSVCGGVLSRDIVGRVFGSVKRGLCLPAAWLGWRSGLTRYDEM
jgi:hypothetical protein